MKRNLCSIALMLAIFLLFTTCQKEQNLVGPSDIEGTLKSSHKVSVYHLTGNGSYQLIEINENALPAHLAHGDLLAVVPLSVEQMAQDAQELLEDPTKWYFYNDGPENEGIDPGLGTFVSGPGSPPEGTGSAQMSVTGNERYNLANSQFGGTLLSEITSFSFITYNPSTGNGGSSARSGYMHFNVSFDGTHTFQYRLIFVPRDNGTVIQDTWQEWDALGDGNTLWRWSGFGAFGNQWPDGNTDDLRTWNNILSSFPDIQMHTLYPFLAVRVGEPYADGYTENIDAVKFGVNGIDQVFDFED
ncbi:MAG: hypothetical protein P8100_07330 [bacterium]